MKDLSECTVLVVDDVPANVDVLVQTLRGDYRLSVALNGEGALKIAAKTSPDLILLDVMMPGLDGYDVCRRLRAQPATRETPVLFLSALDEAWDKVLAFEAGGTDYVAKPFEPMEVRARVKSLLKAKIYQDAVRERITAELSIAREIQMSLVPTEFAPLLRGTPFDAYARLEPAREIGGDLYQLFPVAEGQLCAFAGDVSGTGIPAALFMAISSTLIRATARQCADPNQILIRVNDELVARDNPADMFVTLACAVIDAASARVRLASAGHPSPILLRPNEPPRLVLERAGSALGIARGARFEGCELTLEPGDTLLLYTDGVTQAWDPAQDCFSEERLLRHLAASAGGGPRETVDGVFAAVRAFSDGATQSDDVAVLALRYAPPAGGLRVRT